MKLNLNKLIKIFHNGNIRYSFNSGIYDQTNKSFINQCNRTLKAGRKLLKNTFFFRRRNKGTESKEEYSHERDIRNFTIRNNVMHSITFGGSIQMLHDMISSNALNGNSDGDINICAILPVRFLYDPLEFYESDSFLRKRMKIFINKIFTRNKLHLAPNDTVVLNTSVELEFVEDIPINYIISIKPEYRNSGLVIINNQGRVIKGEKINRLMVHASKPLVIRNLENMFTLEFYQ